MSQTAMIIANLQRAYEYAFVDNTSYYFIFPKESAYVPVKVEKKSYHCFHCGRAIDVDFQERGPVYIENEKLESQKEIYLRNDWPFPDIANGAALIYRVEGYCEDCSTLLKNNTDSGQKIADACKQMQSEDSFLAASLPTILDEAVKRRLNHIAGETIAADITVEEAQQILVKQLYQDDELLQLLSSYRHKIKNLKASVVTMLPEVEDIFEAFAARSVAVFESMARDIYNEYTVLYPAKNASNEQFYQKTVVRKDRVVTFLEQRRVETVADCIEEHGLAECWLQWFAERLA